MAEQHILTVRELADYIRYNEKNMGTLDTNDNYFKFMANGQWNFELASVDHYLQQRLIEASDEELDMVIKSGNNVLSLSSLIDETLINLDFHAHTKNKVLSNLAKMASTSRVAPSYEELYLELESREKVFTTAIGNGVAIPHSRFPYQLVGRQPKLIFVRSGIGVDFGALDHKSVHVFLMPCASTQLTHLRMMAQIAKLLHFPKVIEQLKNTTKIGDIHLIIRSFEQAQATSHSDVGNMNIF